MTPFKRRILDAVIPPTARWIVAMMRRLEEMNLEPAARWEILRKALERVSQGG